MKARRRLPARLPIREPMAFVGSPVVALPRCPFVDARHSAMGSLAKKGIAGTSKVTRAPYRPRLDYLVSEIGWPLRPLVLDAAARPRILARVMLVAGALRLFPSSGARLESAFRVFRGCRGGRLSLGAII